MDLFSRLKNNVILRNRVFTPVYFLVTAAVAAILQLTENPPFYNPQGDLPGVVVAVFSFIFYVIIAVCPLLSVNYTLNNHRHTLGLYAFCLILFSIPVAIILILDQKHPFGALFLVPVDAILMFFLYLDIARREKAKLTMLSYAYVIFFSGVLVYLAVSYAMYSYGGITLAILGMTVLISGALSAFWFLYERQATASLDNLKKRFEAYLNAVFKDIPFTDENLMLREQLSDNLINYAENALNSGNYRENAVYRAAVDSLGDYSALIKKYKKNPLARLTRTNNFFTGVFTLLISETTFITYCVLGAREGQWGEALPILIFFPQAGFAILLFIRVINNFREKNHKYTALCGGLGLTFSIFVSWAGVRLASDQSKPFLGILLAAAGMFIISFAAEFLIDKYLLKNKKKE